VLRIWRSADVEGDLGSLSAVMMAETGGSFLVQGEARSELTKGDPIGAAPWSLLQRKNRHFESCLIAADNYLFGAEL
jgi:hypothetical protein